MPVWICLFVNSGFTAGSQPQWLQCAELSNPPDHAPDDSERQSLGAGYLRKSLMVEQSVTSATLFACGDGTFMDLFVGGERIAEREPFDPVLGVDVTQQCVEGKLVVAIHLQANPPIRCAGFVRLDIRYGDGTTQSIVSDDQWRCSQKAPVNWTEKEFDDTTWQAPVLLGAVDERLLIPRDRGINIDAAENYDQWKQALDTEEGTDPASFRLTAGFEIERLRSARQDEDSWVSLAVDPKGRLIIAKEQKGLLRMTMSADGSIETVESVNDTMKECRGLLFIGDDLYVNANNSKGLYRLPVNDEDQFGEPELLYESGGGVGHGRNDLALGPDGKIYSIHGDSVDLPADCRDFSSPFRDARRGIKTSEGHLLRIDPQMKAVDVVAVGLRNPFGIAFNSQGDCFTYDADAEYDMGAPWYRPTRVSHLTQGSDYGWRGVTKQWPPYFPDHPDNGTPGLDIGKGSPTAVKFGTLSNFPPRYRDALFILDWTYGRIIAVHTIPRGSSYLMTAETFLQGRPLNVTDLEFGNDGAMYFVTGGRKTQSALYRVRYTGPDIPPTPTSQQQAYRNRIAISMHSTRRAIESPADTDVANLLNAMGSNDPWIRNAARNRFEELTVGEQLPFSAWQKAAFREATTERTLSALLSLARSGDPDSREKILKRLFQIDWRSMSRTWRQTAVYTMSLCIADWLPPSPLRAQLLTKLEGVYPDREFTVNRVISELLVRLDSTSVVDTTLQLAANATVQAEQMHYLFIIRNARKGWNAKRRESFFRLLANSSDYVGGQGMSDFLNKIRSDAIESLSDAERNSLAKVIEATALRDDTPTELTPQRPAVQDWTHEALLAALTGLKGQGNSERGKQLFTAASCVHCHRVGGNGRLFGPDLTNVSRRFGRSDLLSSILEPSKVIPEKYQSLQVVTTDGRIFKGLPALGGDYRSTKLRLATDPNSPYEVTEIEKQQIDELRPSPISWMPSGLLNTLSAEEVADLLAYLNTGQ